MEENLTKEVSNREVSSPISIETDHENRVLSISPERLLVEAKIAVSPVGNEVHIDSQRTNSSDDNSENDDRTTDRENSNTDGFDQELLIQRHSDLSSTLASMESSFTCKFPGCSFSSIDAEEFLRHEDTHVDGGAVFCDVCNIRFATYANMRRHHLYTHQGIRTFECQYCSKRFLRKEQYLEHLDKHTKPRPYQCSICGGSFSLRNQLKSHLTNDHPTIIVGKACHLCNFKASSPHAVRIHYATFHLKQTMGFPAVDLPTDAPRSSHGNSESSAIDLATASQNFSLIAPHYSSYPSINSNGAGPSDLSQRAKIIHVNTSVGSHNMTHVVDPSLIVSRQGGNTRHPCVSSVAGSTVISPATILDRSGRSLETQNNESLLNDRICVKPEPPELCADDSQNGSVQPTSTIDLSNTEIVETTSSMETNSLDMASRHKVHKHSSTDDITSDSQSTISTTHYNHFRDAHQSTLHNMHTCCRFRPYVENNQRCRDFPRHTCSNRRPISERRSRFSDGDVDRHPQSDLCDAEERKVFFSRATSTNPGEVPPNGTNPISALACEGSAGLSAESNYYVPKSSIAIQGVESCTLTCAYCGIIFPDQTLYLLHRSLHSEASPWRCNLCGKSCKDKYDFNSHIISKGHY